MTNTVKDLHDTLTKPAELHATATVRRDGSFTLVHPDNPDLGLDLSPDLYVENGWLLTAMADGRPTALGLYEDELIELYAALAATVRAIGEQRNLAAHQERARLGAKRVIKGEFY